MTPLEDRGLLPGQVGAALKTTRLSTDSKRSLRLLFRQKQFPENSRNYLWLLIHGYGWSFSPMGDSGRSSFTKPEEK